VIPKIGPANYWHEIVYRGGYVSEEDSAAVEDAKFPECSGALDPNSN